MASRRRRAATSFAASWSSLDPSSTPIASGPAPAAQSSTTRSNSSAHSSEHQTNPKASRTATQARSPTYRIYTLHLPASYSPQRRHVRPSIRPIARAQASECSGTLCRQIPAMEQSLVDYVQSASRNVASRCEISSVGGGIHDSSRTTLLHDCRRPPQPDQTVLEERRRQTHQRGHCYDADDNARPARCAPREPVARPPRPISLSLSASTPPPSLSIKPNATPG
jgi:hypothetical protein